MHILKRILKTAVISSISVFFAFFTLVFTIVFFTMVLVAVVNPDVEDSQTEAHYAFVHGNENADQTLHSIPISGVILGESYDLGGIDALSLSGVTYGYDIKDELVRLADEKEGDGVILEIHSPGGTIYGTQAIVDGVAYYKEKTGNPVVAYVGSIAASGGYWAATSADAVIADSGTGVGSIGVIQGPFKHYDAVLNENYGAFLGGVETKNGITTEYITAGNSKDLGNPYRPLSDIERSKLQKGVDNAYSLFVAQVAKARNITEQEVREEIGAFVYDEQQAKEIKLIDEVGSKEFSYSFLAEKVGLDDYKVVRYEPLFGLFGSLFKVMETWRPTQSVHSPLCSLQQSVLAYHGEISVMCS